MQATIARTSGHTAPAGVKPTAAMNSGKIQKKITTASSA